MIVLAENLMKIVDEIGAEAALIVIATIFSFTALLIFIFSEIRRSIALGRSRREKMNKRSDRYNQSRDSSFWSELRKRDQKQKKSDKLSMENLDSELEKIDNFKIKK